jgi:hypothetical protein
VEPGARGSPTGRATTGGAGPEDGPAAALGALVPPLRFASRDGFAGLPRLVGFGETVRSAVSRARDAGAPDSAALLGLAAEPRSSPSPRS